MTKANSKMFKKAGASPVLTYEFSKDKSTAFQALKDLPTGLQTENTKTELDSAKSWANFAKISIEDPEFGESSIPIWSGHYEQFGRVMLEIIRICRDKNQKPHHKNIIPDISEITFMGEPSGTEDRTFYRLWFNFIGHPEFQYAHIDNYEKTTYAWWGLLMTWAISNIEMEMLDI